MHCSELMELIDCHRLRFNEGAVLHLLSCDACSRQWLVAALLMAANVEHGLSATGRTRIADTRH